MRCQQIWERNDTNMSQLHSTLESIQVMLDRGRYTTADIQQALADLEAMRPNISDYQYRSMKALLEAKL